MEISNDNKIYDATISKICLLFCFYFFGYFLACVDFRSVALNAGLIKMLSSVVS